MAAFLHHEACPACGSRDNLGRYSDGSAWCFGCGYKERADGSSSYHRARLYKQDQEDNIESCKPLPDDFNQEFPEHILEWVYQYGITVEELLRYQCGYSKRNNQLINTFFDESGQLVLWSARNFWPKARSKYYVTGDKNGTSRFFPSRSLRGSGTSNLIIVEDCMSAIKTARYSDSWPLLGSTMPNNVLASLRGSNQAGDGLRGGYDRLDIWLDPDKMDNALRIAQRASYLGFKTNVIYTDKDPKECSDEVIQQKLLDK